MSTLHARKKRTLFLMASGKHSSSLDPEGYCAEGRERERGKGGSNNFFSEEEKSSIQKDADWGNLGGKGKEGVSPLGVVWPSALGKDGYIIGRERVDTYRAHRKNPEGIVREVSVSTQADRGRKKRRVLSCAANAEGNLPAMWKKGTRPSLPGARALKGIKGGGLILSVKLLARNPGLHTCQMKRRGEKKEEE